ncbi:MAG TPA: S8 family peptidase, partial [Burkholderiaceae bacterium]|nr:S8 family peptidase [Burkholderiaceae bacterium]
GRSRPAWPVLALASAALLAACGGGGSQSGPSETAAAAKVDPASSSLPVPAKTVAEDRVASQHTTSPSARESKTQGKNAASRLYIVQLVEDPVVAYKGGIAGFAATKPSKGNKIDPNNPQVVNYFGYLTGRHDALLASVGAAGKKAYSYGYAFNGFAAEVSDAQAAKLAMSKGVLAVSKDEMRELDTATTPAFLGLSGDSGFWKTTGATGEGVIIGIVDGGVWPESLSFTDRTGENGNATKDGKLDYQQLAAWHGRCIPGDQFTATQCNQKLIGARWYNAGFGGDTGIREQLPWEFVSPRDYGGHGTHTASTAGGNANVPITGPAAVFGKINGIAPRARIAAYKVCWQTPAGGSCATTDSVAAIDQAVADGVDVINFSISGSTTNFLDPVEVAFFNAADAGVFVAASAGNSGPTTATVAHPSPWLTTVAAGTHNRSGEGSVTLGNGVSYTGASLAAATGSKPLIDATAAGLAGADPVQVTRCFAAEDNGGVAVLDPAKVAGKIVVCDRGDNPRVNKSLAVQEAGGVGMILVNTSPNSLNADFHAVPTVHLQDTGRAAVKAYAATAGAAASIAQASIVLTTPAPFTASFSSRGPLKAGGGDLLKPDLIAPGQDILAAVAPPGNGGRSFDLYSGTSMSSPHVAGLGALMKQLHPNWSPMAIKSALMTTGSDVLDGPNTNPLVIFRQGAGHVQPLKAADPGLVFDSGFIDWLGFLCGTGQLTASYCPSIRIDPSDLNVPSIAIGDMAGVQTVTRKVTNVGSGSATYTPSYTGMTGFTVNVSPATMQLNPGQTKRFTVSFTRSTAAANAYTGGQLTWTDGTHKVRIPMVVRPVALAAPATVSGTGGPISYDVIFGYAGSFTATPRGLVTPTITAGTVADDPSNGSCTLSSPNAQLIDVVVPANTTYARFATFDADVNAGSDIDMCVFLGTTQVGSSGTGTSSEEVNLVNPAAGTYTVVVQGWGVVGSTPFKLHSWMLGDSAVGNMSLSAPTTAAIGATGTVTLTFSGLSSGTKYLGSVVYGGAIGMPNPTIVRVDTP